MIQLHPTRAALAAISGLIWAVSFGAVRDFVWADLREGLINTRGLPRVARLLVWIGFGLLLTMVVALLASDVWRAQSALLALPNLSSDTSGRGALLPAALLPMTLFLITLAWTFMLLGVLHAHWVLRLLALAVFVPFVLLWSLQSSSDVVATLASVGAVAGVVVLFAVRWRRASNPGLEFTLLLALIALAVGIGHWSSVRTFNTSGQPLVAIAMQLALAQLHSLALPLLFLIGIDIASFTRQAASWTAQVVDQRLPRLALGVLLVGGLGLRLFDVLGEARAQITGLDALGPYLGGLLSLLAVAGVWLLIAQPWQKHHIPPVAVAEAVERWALPLVLLYLAPLLIGDTLVNILGIVGIGTLLLTGGIGAMGQLSGTLDVGAASIWWMNAFALLALGVAAVLAWRGQRLLALYLGAFGVLALWSWLSEPGLVFAALARNDDVPIDLWLLVLLAAMAIWWAARRTLSRQRAVNLLFLLVVTGLLRQTDFIENPFSPFLGFAGVGFVAFGLVWDMLTAGSWANEDTQRLPRVGRVFLYIGYVLLTVTLINWALASHNLGDVNQFTGELAVRGLGRFGKPLLYMLFPLVLALPAETAVYQHVEAAEGSQSP